MALHPVASSADGPAAGAPWRCPICRDRLHQSDDKRQWACAANHSFDVARERYVNLLVAGQRKSRQPGDSKEMIGARRRFLGTGAYDAVSKAAAAAITEVSPEIVLDVGCGEGRHTTFLEAPIVLGIDVAKAAVAVAAKAHPNGHYAVASAADLPLEDASVDAVLDVFGPVFPEELARVLRPGGIVVAVHPGPQHLASLRALVYPNVRPHELKPPLRNATGWFRELGSEAVSFRVGFRHAEMLMDLFVMTPYRWHAPPDIGERLAEAASAGFHTTADVHVTTYRRAG